VTDVTPDMRALATAVLAGDAFACLALADCVVENASGNRERVNREYVELLEDTLHAYKTAVQFSKNDRYNHFLAVSDVQTLYSSYFKCERMARTLNRQGLS
jgi:hypothetical protein